MATAGRLIHAGALPLQRLRPATSQLRPATQGMRPATRQLRPDAQKTPPDTRRPATQRMRPATRRAQAGQFSMVRNVLPEGENFPETSGRRSHR